jgi:hypothetical protein
VFARTTFKKNEKTFIFRQGDLKLPELTLGIAPTSPRLEEVTIPIVVGILIPPILI